MTLKRAKGAERWSRPGRRKRHDPSTATEPGASLELALTRVPRSSSSDCGAPPLVQLCPSAVSRFKSGGAARTVALGRDGSLGARAMSGDEAKLERLLEMLEASVRPRARTRPVV